MAIIQHLQMTLDTDKGQDLARELDGLYAYTLGRIVEGSTKLDANAIEAAIKVLSELLPAWEEIATKELKQFIPPTLLTSMTASSGGFQLQA